MRGAVVGVLVLVCGGLAMFSFFRSRSFDLTQVKPPWGSRPSIYRHVKSHLAPSGKGVTTEGQTLPDDTRGTGDVRWMAGAMDGVMGHHARALEENEAAGTLAKALAKASRSSDQANIDALYAALTAQTALELVDPFLELLRSDQSLPADRMHSLAAWLATNAADREAVKIGIALLGIFTGPGDDELLLTLGRHEEFTVFSTVALGNTAADPEAVLWTLAKGVDGWGRIQTVERLANTSTPAIKGWLLREGYQNSVMYEYLAYTCAVQGELAKALEGPEIDGPLFDGAGELLHTLIDGRGGPAQGIDDYDRAADATHSYLRHAETKAQTLKHFLAVNSIADFLATPANATSWPGASGAGARTCPGDRGAA